MARPRRLVHLRPHDDCRHVDISNDGRWIATGSHWGSKVKVWDSATGDLVVELPVETASRARFSPDDRWLTTTGGGLRLWSVSTWEEGPAIQGWTNDFSPDGRIMAADTFSGTVRLLDTDTWLEFAELEHPGGYYGSYRYLFTPDGASMVAVHPNGLSGFAWDMRRIREELAARGLDWAAPPYPAADTDLAPSPVEVKLLLERSDAKSPLENAADDIARLRKAYDSNPEDAGACNELAWVLVTAPEPLRGAQEAVKLAEKAVRLSPDNVNIQNTLGVTYYRAGRYREAADCLAANLSQPDHASLGYDLYFLAMSYFQLGETDHARNYLLWANGWMDAQSGEGVGAAETTSEVAAFRLEAEGLIRRDPKDARDL
jgi:hypothetical protein